MVMLNKNMQGSINSLTFPFIVVTLLAIGFGVFSVWAFTNYNQEKNHVNDVVATEVAAAEKAKEAELKADFAEQMKSPYRTYNSSQALGSIKLVYPNSWSAYIEEDENGSVGLDGYFQPGFVPDIRSDNPFALRIKISSSDYARELERYQRDVEDGTLKAKAITISGAKGTRLDGEIERDVKGAIVLLPLRDKTLEIWTESTDYLNDFNKTISQLKYSP